MKNQRPMLEFEVAHTCDLDAPIPLRIAWEVRLSRPKEECAEEAPPGSLPCDALIDLENADCPGVGLCQLLVPHIRAAPDGSLWVVAEFNSPVLEGDADTPARGSAGVLLYHYASDGTQLSAQPVTSVRVEHVYAQHYPELAVDSRGHVFVGVTRVLADELASPTPEGDPPPPEVSQTLFEFDAAGRPVGAPIAFVPIELPIDSSWHPLRVNVAGAELAVAQEQFGGGGIGLMDPNTRNLRWVQSRGGRLGFSHLVGDAQGALSMLTRSPNGMASGRLEHYEPDGRLSWERGWRPPQASSRGGGVGLGVDAQGELAITTSETSEPDNGMTSVFKLSRSGEPLWAMHTPNLVSYLFDQGSTVVRSADLTGNATLPSGEVLYMPLVLERADGGVMNVLLAVSADGTRCRHYQWQPTDRRDGNIGFDDQLSVGPDAQVYVRLQTGFARLEFDRGMLP